MVAPSSNAMLQSFVEVSRTLKPIALVSTQIACFKSCRIQVLCPYTRAFSVLTSKNHISIGRAIKMATKCPQTGKLHDLQGNDSE